MRTALVVDDSMLIRHMVCRFLEERGYAVESASNGVEALEALRTMEPSLIVSDMIMPKMDGCELIARLKAEPKWETIPLVVLTGRASSGEPQPEQADYIVHKDKDISAQLERTLDSILRKQQEQDAANQAQVDAVQA